MAKIQALNEAEINRLKHTRLIMASFIGKDPRRILPLPGDWDHLVVYTPQERIELAERMGMKLTDEFKQGMLNGRRK